MSTNIIIFILGFFGEGKGRWPGEWGGPASGEIQYDQIPSGLLDRIQRILPLADKVADEIVCEETELLEKVIPRMFGVMYRVAKVSCDYVKYGRRSCY